MRASIEARGSSNRGRKPSLRFTRRIRARVAQGNLLLEKPSKRKGKRREVDFGRCERSPQPQEPATVGVDELSRRADAHVAKGSQRLPFERSPVTMGIVFDQEQATFLAKRLETPDVLGLAEVVHDEQRAYVGGQVRFQRAPVRRKVVAQRVETHPEAETLQGMHHDIADGLRQQDRVAGSQSERLQSVLQGRACVRVVVNRDSSEGWDLPGGAVAKHTIPRLEKSLDVADTVTRKTGKVPGPSCRGDRARPPRESDSPVR